MSGQIRLVTLTILLTALIWFHADQVGEATENVSVQIALVPDPNWHVSPAQWPLCRVTFRGTNRAIQSLRTRTRGGVLRIEQEPSALPGFRSGQWLVDFALLLRQMDVVNALGLRVSAAVPATHTVQVEQLESRLVKVHVAPPRATLSGQPTVMPLEVTALLPVRLWEQQPDAQFAVVTLDDGVLAQAVSGEPSTATVPVAVPAAWNDFPITLTPNVVQVTFQVQSTSLEEVFNTVPIRLSFSTHALQKQWCVLEVDEFASITLEGPTAVIGELREKRAEIRLSLDVTTDDIPSAGRPAGQPIRRKLRLSLPAWAAGAVREVEMPEVAFTLAQRMPAG